MAGIPPQFLRREDESPDRDFYREPRFVTHIDDATIDALSEFYAEFLPEDVRILDLMSSWISHLPEQRYRKIVGLGMNAEELAANPRLDEFLVQDLNERPRLPFPAGSFDRILIAVSVQYLVQPVDVLSSAREILSDGGQIVIAMSHRLFPTKAVAAFTSMAAGERIQLVQYYLKESGFADITFIDRSPANADPLWLVTGTSRLGETR